MEESTILEQAPVEAEESVSAEDDFLFEVAQEPQSEGIHQAAVEEAKGFCYCYCVKPT